MIANSATLIKSLNVVKRERAKISELAILELEQREIKNSIIHRKERAKIALKLEKYKIQILNFQRIEVVLYLYYCWLSFSLTFHCSKLLSQQSWS